MHNQSHFRLSQTDRCSAGGDIISKMSVSTSELENMQFSKKWKEKCTFSVWILCAVWPCRIWGDLSTPRMLTSTLLFQQALPLGGRRLWVLHLVVSKDGGYCSGLVRSGREPQQHCYEWHGYGEKEKAFLRWFSTGRQRWCRWQWISRQTAVMLHSSVFMCDFLIENVSTMIYLD